MNAAQLNSLTRGQRYMRRCHRRAALSRLRFARIETLESWRLRWIESALENLRLAEAVTP